MVVYFSDSLNTYFFKPEHNICSILYLILNKEIYMKLLLLFQILIIIKSQLLY